MSVIVGCLSDIRRGILHVLVGEPSSIFFVISLYVLIKIYHCCRLEDEKSIGGYDSKRGKGG
jgi:hypothetical protein